MTNNGNTIFRTGKRFKKSISFKRKGGKTFTLTDAGIVYWPRYYWIINANDPNTTNSSAGEVNLTRSMYYTDS